MRNPYEREERTTGITVAEAQAIVPHGFKLTYLHRTKHWYAQPKAMCVSSKLFKIVRLKTDKLFLEEV